MGLTSEIIFALFFSSVFCSRDVPCNKIEKEYGYVCACNATYCDKTNSPNQLSVEKFHFYYTSKNLPGFNHDIGHFRSQSVSSYGHKYEINRTKTFQKIRGFGGAFTDSFGFTVNTMSEDVQDNLLRSFFGEDGIEYTTCRVVIGSSDFSLRDYSYLPHYDPSLKSFNLTEDDYKYKINHIKKAINISKRRLKFLGSAWNAPAWMKINVSTNASYLKSEFRQLWADYHVKFLDFFRAEGIEFWALTTGNEPFTLFLAKAMPIVVMFPEEQREWVVNNLGPSLEKNNYTTEIIVFDDMRMYAEWWMDSIMRDKRAHKYVSGIGLHFYTDPYISPNILDSLHEKYPNQEIIYTESSMNFLMNYLIKDVESNKSETNIISHATSPRLGSWSSGSYYAVNIIENLKHWTTTYIDWNLALNEDGGPYLKSSCDASIIVNETRNEFYKQPLFYIMGHFSKFIQPDAVVINVNLLNDSNNRSSVDKQTTFEELLNEMTKNQTFFPTVSENVQFVGALNPDSSTSIIFYNPKSTSVQIEVYDPDRGSAYLILEPNSLSTLLYW